MLLLECMKSIFPSKLKKGDTICVIAPASSIVSFKPKNLKRKAMERMEKSLGLKVVFSKNSHETNKFYLSSIKSRVSDLHSAFKNKNVKGIACARGGFNSNEFLSYIDWNIIKKNPKPIWGYSDITVLSNALYAKTGLVTYSGPTFSTMGAKEEKNIMKYILESFQKCLMTDVPFNIIPSKYFNERKLKAQKNKGLTVLQSGNCKGTVIGGNLCSLNLLQGTPYMPDLKNKILFLEDDDFGGKLSPLEFARNLESLLQCKDGLTVKGIVLGRFQKGFNMDIDRMKFILSNTKISKNIPIIYNVDFGHTAPMITFPIGGEVAIQATKSKASIQILKH